MKAIRTKKNCKSARYFAELIHIVFSLVTPIIGRVLCAIAIKSAKTSENCPSSGIILTSKYAYHLRSKVTGGQYPRARLVAPILLKVQWWGESQLKFCVNKKWRQKDLTPFLFNLELAFSLKPHL
jgi:hypothetical protein|tara:strand:- start:16 stop:390 length:375 start_codon:yes stop_codon:yes gene_type:complete